MAAQPLVAAAAFVVVVAAGPEQPEPEPADIAAAVVGQQGTKD